MTIRIGKNGPFLACSGYPQCKQTMNFIRDERGKIQPQEEAPEAASEKECPQCGKPMVVRKGRFGAFWACSGYPQCRETQPLIQGGQEGPGDNPRAHRPGLPAMRQPHAPEKKSVWGGIPGLREIS